MKDKPKGFINLDGITVSFRFILPVLAVAYFYAYQGDMHNIKDSISDIKDSQKQNLSEVKASQAKIWETLSNFKDKTNEQFNFIYQRIH